MDAAGCIDGDGLSCAQLIPDAVAFVAPGQQTTPRANGAQEYDVVPYRPTSPDLENHHGVLDTWAKNNVEGYVSRAGDSPTVALSPEAHARTQDVYRDRLEERTGKRVGGKIDWTQVSAREAYELSERMFDAAGVPQSARNEYFGAFNSYIYQPTE